MVEIHVSLISEFLNEQSSASYCPREIHSYQFHVSDNSFHTLPTNENLHISPILSSCGLTQLTAKCHTAIHSLSAHIKRNAIGKTVRRKNVKLKG